MFSARLLRSWMSRFVQPVPSRQTRRGLRSRQKHLRPVLETLEDRNAPAVFTVTNTGDNGGIDPAPGAGTGTLRQAIVDADAAGTGTAASPDLIAFDIPTTDPGYNSATGAFTIQPLSALPVVTDTVDINGYTQSGATANTLAVGDNAVLNIVLDGTQAGSVFGLVLGGGNSTVSGLVIDNFAAEWAIDLRGSGNDTVTGNFIGTDVTGESAALNANGIALDSPNNTIGGIAPGDRNIVSGNDINPNVATGVGLFGNGNLIEGNYIGTDKTGTAAVANGFGIADEPSFSNNTIGGTAAGAGNLISGNGVAMLLTGNQDLVAGNLIGTSATGLAALGNGEGIEMSGGNNTIGGITAGARNIISANSNPLSNIGVFIGSQGPGVAQGNLVEGNYFGTDITGANGLGAQLDIWLGAFAEDNTIGGSTPGARNVISDAPGPNELSVFISDNLAGFTAGPTASSPFGNTVLGNYIGTDVSGTRFLGGQGVQIGNAAYDNTVGGTLPGAGNVICGEGFGGDIFLGNDTPGASTSGATENVVQGNFLGTDSTGTIPLGSGGPGILIDSNNNTIGGTQPGAGNVIADNDGPGVFVELGTGNSILGNSVYGNGGNPNPIFGTGGQGIVLDGGYDANDDQTTPVLISGSTSSAATNLSGTLTSVASTTFRIEFFANPGLDASGNAEGQTYLGFTTVTTNSSGTATFSASNLAAIPAGDLYVTATATNETTGDTSQFSSYLAVPTTTHLTASASPALFGQSVTLTATVSANFAGFGTPTGSVTFVDTTTGATLGTVALSGGKATLTTATLNADTQTITATYTASTPYLGSSATLSLTVTPSILVLDPTAGGALTLSGNADINTAGDVVVDSDSKTALTLSGNAAIKAAATLVVGGVSKSCGTTLSPAPVTGAASVANPLAGVVAPGTSGLTNYGSACISGNTTTTLKPGIYSQITISGNATVTLNAGVYLIEGGGFSVSGNAKVTGSGVTIFNAGSDYPNSGGTYGAVSWSGNSTISLTAPTTGTYAGLVLVQISADAKVLTISGNTSGMVGTILAPTAQLQLSGNSQLSGAIVVDTLTISGNSVAKSLDAPSGTVAYTPAQIRTAYGINDLSLDGTGQTIAIVDAYDDPDVYQSVDAFDSQFGLTTSGPTLYDQYGPVSSFLTVLNESGQTTNLPTTDPAGPGASNWEVEEALDVEWTHAIAPGAQIVLVEANSQSLSDLMASVATAAQQPGVSVVSMSWGFAEGTDVSAQDEATYDPSFTTPAGHTGVTFVASAGDSGAAVPEYPAVSPNVVAVGGTTLTLNTDSSYQSETGWGDYSDSAGAFIGSGGGISQYETEPAYQQGVQSTGWRTGPDVAFVADPNTGAWVADAYNQGTDDPWEVVGGTSLSAPAWAGLLALVDQGRVAAGEATLGTAGPQEAQTALYGLSQADYNPITSGNNGYSAGPGYNLVAGLGSPVANLLVPDLAAYTGGPGSSTPVAPIAASGLVLSPETGSGATSTDAALTVFAARTMVGLTDGTAPSAPVTSAAVTAAPVGSLQPTPAIGSGLAVAAADGTGVRVGVTASVSLNPNPGVTEPVYLSPDLGTNTVPAGADGYGSATEADVTAGSAVESDGVAGMPVAAAAWPRGTVNAVGGPAVAGATGDVPAAPFSDEFPDFAPILVARPDELM